MRRAVAAAASILVLSAACGRDGGASAELGEAPRRPSTTLVTTTTTTVAATPADTPDALAAQLARVETAIRNPATPAADLAALGNLEQVATGVLVTHPDWQAEVVSRLPAAARAAVEANVLAGTELAKLATNGPRPVWRIVAPPPAPDLLAEYRSAEAATGVPWQYLAAIHLVESRMGRIRGDSTAGAQGPMQFLPSTWAAYGGGGDINSYHDAIQAAARYLKANGAPTDMANALYRYNPSQHYVRAITAYAAQMQADERAYFGYYNWQVYAGGKLLPVGFVG
jgi:hypothetical protein